MGLVQAAKVAQFDSFNRNPTRKHEHSRYRESLFPWPGFPRTTVRLTADRGANRQACSAFHQFDDTPVFALALVQRALILAMILALVAALIFGRAV